MDNHTFLEIIGIAQESKWNNIKDFIRYVIHHTLDEEDIGYELTVDNINLKGSEQQFNILKPADITVIDTIASFDSISLLQITEHRRDHVTISREGPFIVVIAKYYGPLPKNPEYFDFSINIDIIHNPRFIHSDGSEIKYSELISRLNPSLKKEISVIDQWEAVRQQRRKATVSLEHRVYEKITRMKAIEDGEEVPSFQLWREKTAKEYQTSTGGKSHRKENITKGYEDHLLGLMYKSITSKKNRTPKKTLPEEPLTKEQEQMFSLEARIYELIKGRSALNKKGKYTKLFQSWSKKTAVEFRDWTGERAHFNKGMTKRYKQYLHDLEQEIKESSDNNTNE